jgi:hypothetical protein
MKRQSSENNILDMQSRVTSIARNAFIGQESQLSGMSKAMSSVKNEKNEQKEQQTSASQAKASNEKSKSLISMMSKNLQNETIVEEKAMRNNPKFINKSTRSINVDQKSVGSQNYCTVSRKSHNGSQMHIILDDNEKPVLKISINPISPTRNPNAEQQQIEGILTKTE